MNLKHTHDTMMLKCPNCGEQYEIQSKGSLDGFAMRCQSCGTEISTADEIKVTPVVNKSGEVYVNKKSRFGCLWKFFIILLVAMGILATTVPDKKKHFDELSSFVTDVAIDNNTGGIEGFFGQAFTMGIANLAIGMTLEVDDYFLFSVGRIKTKDIDRIVSVGLLNHVFVLADKQKLNDAIN